MSTDPFRGLSRIHRRASCTDVGLPLVVKQPATGGRLSPMRRFRAGSGAGVPYPGSGSAKRRSQLPAGILTPPARFGADPAVFVH